MRVLRQRKGQFIVIAALLLSIMIVSVSTVIYGTVTYFRQERWEEYVTIVDSVKTGSSNVLDISLANYSQTLNSTVLRDNLNQWIRDVRKAYLGYGVSLTYALPGSNKLYFHGGSYVPYPGLPTPAYAMDSTTPSGSQKTITLNYTGGGGTPIWFYQYPPIVSPYVFSGTAIYNATFWVENPTNDDATLYAIIMYYNSTGTYLIPDISWNGKSVGIPPYSGIRQTVFSWIVDDSWTLPAGSGFVFEIWSGDSTFNLIYDSVAYPSHIEVPLEGAVQAYGVSIYYNMGLARTWNQPVSFSAANATFNLNIASVGLTGYSFSTHAFLKMNITDALWYPGQKQNPGQVGVRVVIHAEGPTPVTNLQKGNFLLFQIGSENKTFTLYRYYESKGHDNNPPLNAFVYELRYTHSTNQKPDRISVRITISDSRGVQVKGAVNSLPVTNY